MVFLSSQGYCITRIARILNASENTIRQWIARHEAYDANSLNDKPRGGRPTKVSTANRAPFEECVCTGSAGLGYHCSTWTAGKLCSHVWTRYRVEIGSLCIYFLRPQGSCTTVGGTLQDEDEIRRERPGWIPFPRPSAFHQPGIMYSTKMNATSTDDGGLTDIAEETIEIVNLPPEVEIVRPTAGQVLTGEATIEWVAVDPDDDADKLKITLEYRSAAGEDWQIIASGEPNTGKCIWDTSKLERGGKHEILLFAPLGRELGGFSEWVFKVDPFIIAGEL